MANVDITKMSSKGQIVIPRSMREGIAEGASFLIIKKDNSFILKKTGVLDEKFKEDLEFAKRTEEAYKRHEKGESKTLSSEKFLEELEKW